MGYTGSPEISKYNDKDFTKITFKPDLKRFKMDRLDEDIVSLLKKRVYDLCGVLKDIKVYLNGQKIEISNFKQYCQLYLNEDSKIIHMRVNNRWELAFTISEEQLQHVAFVNSICTSKGGTHVNHVVEQITEAIIENIKKKHKVTNIRPLQVKSQIFIFINSLIENPAFDSQTKENLTLRVSSFGSKCEPIDKFIAEIIKDTPIIERVLISIKAKENAELKKTDGSKKKRVFLPKLEDAELAGTAKSKDCVLVLTEGDSAKALVMAGRSQIGASILGVFPLRGKMLNVREASAKQVAENKEIIALKQILGLQQNKKYEDVSSLRYGHVMVMTDQDHDGSHIKGLLINFFDYFFPSLLKINTFLQEFITPIVRGRNSRGEVVDFYTMPEYEEFKENHPNYIYKYYKGLGTSTSEDAIEYFSNLEKHVKNFIPMEQNDKEFIDLAFNKKKQIKEKHGY
ncbi:dna topoisomerase ii [Vairimorpha apis BRL 01]|uniref:DNA topoisomerase 2 n=1 Tax=Vairimorpha apis BRL 01 TaxID=1037528 RepID=T0LBA6_9MICR|nr:dna topoisomerase ii [Vairimorpha apis BRL 01]